MSSSDAGAVCTCEGSLRSGGGGSWLAGCAVLAVLLGAVARYGCGGAAQAREIHMPVEVLG